jgi:hypothetical protein
MNELPGPRTWLVLELSSSYSREKAKPPWFAYQLISSTSFHRARLIESIHQDRRVTCARFWFLHASHRTQPAQWIQGRRNKRCDRGKRAPSRVRPWLHALVPVAGQFWFRTRCMCFYHVHVGGATDIAKVGPLLVGHCRRIRCQERGHEAHADSGSMAAVKYNDKF